MMQFFFSKFLPLFFLPDGMTCVLLVIVVVTVRSRPRLARFAAAAALVLLLIASETASSLLIMGFLETRNLPPKRLPVSDAIVVLGGGADPARPPRPSLQVSSATANRILYAVELYRENKAPLVILSGGPPGFTETLPPESEEMAKIIETMGVPKYSVIQESTSHNTHENARNVNLILMSRRIHRVLLVTSAFHMPRALKVFRRLGIQATPAPCDFFTDAPPRFSTYKHWQSALVASVPSVEALSETTLALREFLWWIVHSL